MLQISLLENLLTAAPNDMMAQTVNVRSYEMPEIIRRIIARNPGLSESQLSASLGEFFAEVSIVTEDGGAVVTPLFNAQPSVSGVFNSATDNFDAKRHQVKINLSPGTQLRKAVAGIKVQKVQAAEPVPFILEVHDVLSNTYNDLLTPGGVIRIAGGRLKLAADNPENGIFLIGEQGQAVKLPNIVENKPGRLITMLPAELPQGTYSLEVRTTFSSSGKEIKTLKTGRFIKDLTAMGN